MLSFFLLLFVAGGVSSLIPLSELYKIVIVLFTIPGILYVSVKISQRPSTWSLSEHDLSVDFGDKQYSYEYDKIDHIRCLTRSGGNLFVIYLNKKSPVRYWRNKIFQQNDDMQELQDALLKSEIEYFKF